MYLMCKYLCKNKQSKHTEANKHRHSTLAKRRAEKQKQSI